ncbi:MAG: hypothetical protein IKF78_04270 [Atopobiaceae bacterium]|nr:hypothetical protein [Atopobiaceae bacterium]
MDVIGESEENPGTIDETADKCLVVLDNMDMVAVDNVTLSERVRFLKDLVKGTRMALVAVVAGDYDDLWRDLANADEVYVIRYSPRIEPASADFVPGPRRPERRRRTLLRNVKTSRFDGHSFEVEFEIDLPTRTICEVGG